jgi:hypothetical protein
MAESLQERLEALAQALKREQAKSASLEEELAGRAAKESLTVLSASKDLWRGADEKRPDRPDTLRLPVEQAPTPTPSAPTQQDAMEAAVARTLRASGA